ncbi:hypothetical protein AB0M02_44640 [Actinoplanes sp. NPDC051861]|uniref:hypothetical protein n=1 Tax=Actinoplanes sp. NPDC051861 TaxID=3155170 RepID=UPI0034478777
MHSDATGNTRLLAWLRVRQFAVPPTMIKTATARRLTGDWAGACAAARFDTDLNPRAVARLYGAQVAAQLRADLRDLAPDLLRWHFPRVAPDGLLRPGLTLTLARYDPPGEGPLHLVARTPPAWADAGQRISLALWSRSHREPSPDRRFRLDLHRHLWNAHNSPTLPTHRVEYGSTGEPNSTHPPLDLQRVEYGLTGGPNSTHPALDTQRVEYGFTGGPNSTHPPLDTQRVEYGFTGGPNSTHPPLDTQRVEYGFTGGRNSTHSALDTQRVEFGFVGGMKSTHLAGLVGLAVGRWAEEARILLEADGARGPVLVRVGCGRRLLFDPERLTAELVRVRASAGLPILPYAATWVPPDLELLSAGLIEPEALHPLVAAALVPGYRPSPAAAAEPAPERIVDCRGARHRIGLAAGVLAPLDHDPAELRREALLVALGGTPLPCLQAVDLVNRHPESLDDVRARLDHGDYDGALAEVERLLGPSATLREGPLRDELEAAAARRLTHSMYRSGLTGYGPPRHTRPPRRLSKRLTKTLSKTR